MRVLVVEDEHQMAAYVSQALTEESCAVDLAHDGVKGLSLASSYQYDAIILDLMLPGLDGLSLCRKLRASGCQTPVLMLTARDMVDDRVLGLDAGGDDYLTKPFAVEELTARLRALVRRTQGRATPALTVGGIELDPATRVVRRNGQLIALTGKEYAFLEYLMRRPGLVLTRTMIAEHVWDFSFERASNVVDVYVKHLRDKIDEPGRPSFIQAVRGVGYVFRDPSQAEA